MKPKHSRPAASSRFSASAPEAQESSLENELPPQCLAAIENFRTFAEGVLNASEAKRVESHLGVCASCREEFEQSRQLYALMENTLGARQIGVDFGDRAEAVLRQTPQNTGRLEHGMNHQDQQMEMEEGIDDEGAILEAMEPARTESGGWAERMSAAPWWGVSLALHALVLMLAGLVSMAFKLPKPEEAIVTVTELAARPQVEVEPEKKIEKPKDALASVKETPPTDATSKELCDVVVPPEMLAKAELGDHFETINLDKPDTHSAFGNEDAKMFHAVNGNDEPVGGGGEGGALLDDSVIGIGGPAGKGTGGGWGGGNGEGTGTGNGAGHGSFGSRNGGGRKLMVKRHGGTPATEGAVERALAWLARNQEADGHWDSVRHGGRSPGIVGNAAMTGYAVLAFLGAGHSEKVGKYKENVKKGVEYLILNLKDVAGKADAARCSENDYSNGIVCMALGEAAGMARIKETLVAAQKAINGVDAAQRQTAGTSDREAWDYMPNGATNDSSIMAWSILALKSCKVGGLKIDHACFEGCLTWINAGQELGGQKAGDSASYDYEGGMMAYRGTVAAPNKGKGSIAVTAAAGLCRVMIGGAKMDDPGVVGPCNLIKNKHIPTKYPFNLYFGYYASLLMFQKGGDHWKAWNEVLKGPLAAGQCIGGDNDGSWDDYGGIGSSGRVMSTALGCLCMEVYYRYARLNPDAK